MHIRACVNGRHQAHASTFSRQRRLGARWLQFTASDPHLRPAHTLRPMPLLLHHSGPAVCQPACPAKGRKLPA